MCDFWVVLAGVIVQIGGSTDSYIYCMVTVEEQFELFNRWELNPVPQCFIAIEIQYTIIAVMA